LCNNDLELFSFSLSLTRKNNAGISGSKKIAAEMKPLICYYNTGEGKMHPLSGLSVSAFQIFLTLESPPLVERFKVRAKAATSPDRFLIPQVRDSQGSPSL
jgi:hypothetical protein